MSDHIANPSRRSVLAGSAAMGLSLTLLAEPGTAGALEASGSDTLRPFRVNVPQTTLDDLRRRILATRWADRETVPDQTQGVQQATIQALARYWAHGYDWRRCEAKLNALPQFLTAIDGLDIHFIHVRSRHPGALPLIVTHGWPGSIIEQLKIVAPLTDPTAHGGSAADAFHVVIPSLPGYGFSARPTTTGWGPDRVARAWDTLMKRLGYSRYVHQGGDWGGRISEIMGHQAPEGLLGVHANLLLTFPPETTRAIGAGDPPPAGLSEAELATFNQRKMLQPIGYFIEQARRPQTIGNALADSPIGLASWLLDHDPHSYELLAGAIAGTPDGAITRDDILDNITLYWVTNTGASAARLYWEAAHSPPPMGKVMIPAGYTVFPGELYRVPRSWVEYVYGNLIYYNQVDRGGHFAAWEEPELFASEVRAAFRPLRSAA
jgi:pimeloyl-ACP methyl ester carboxylesterase